jgi:hypothetical protein
MTDTLLLATLQGQDSDVLPKVLNGAMHRETMETLEDHVGGWHLATTYFTWLKTGTQLVGESLQKFAIAIERLTHCALPKGHVYREVGKTFVSGIKEAA